MITTADPTLSLYVEEIASALRDGNCAFFCGAGVSLNSGLPLVFASTAGAQTYRGLADEILRRLGLSDAERSVIRESNAPFELLIETISEETDVTPLLNIFRFGEPNINHVLVARLVANKSLRTVCTTNFDLLLERAFEESALTEGDDFQVCRKPADGRSTIWKSTVARLIKLHGSADDVAGMAITISGVAKSEVIDDVRSLLSYIFADGPHTTVVVLGYSCSDTFDISPAIAEMSNDRKRILLIQHAPSPAAGHPLLAVAQPIGNSPAKNPFQKYHGTRLIADTDHFIAELWQRVFGEAPIQAPTSRPSDWWLTNVEQWATEAAASDMETMYHLAAILFWQLSQFPYALVHWKKAYGLAIARGDEVVAAAHLGNLGLVYRDMGQLRRGVSYFIRGLRIARREKNKRVERRLVSNLAGTYRLLGKPAWAIRGHLKALRIARQLNLKKAVGVNLGNLGICHDSMGHYYAAKWYYRHAIRIAQSLGDVRGEASRIVNLAGTLRKTHNFKMSVMLHDKAILLQRGIGDRLAEGNSYGSRALVYQEIGDRAAAVADFKRAISIHAVFLGDDHATTREERKQLESLS